MRIRIWFKIFFTALLLLAVVRCTQLSPLPNADVIVVGAGISGLAAAIEASSHGASVLVIEANSVGGGHAVKAGGLAMVDTALQRQRGIKDSPDIAWQDLMLWGEDANPYWTRRYAEESSEQVYDWLTKIGVRFAMVLDTPEDTVPRFHFTRGTAVNVVVPMMRKALQDPKITFVWNTRVIKLTRSNNMITGIIGQDERNDTTTRFHAKSIILATGGFQNNLKMVRANWPDSHLLPGKLFKGAGQYATGDGYLLARWAGAKMQHMDRQVTFYQGVPDPRNHSGATAFFAQNPTAIWLDNNGRRFVNESANSKTIAAAAKNLRPMNFWMIFDANGSRRLGIRGAAWLNNQTIRNEILENTVITKKALNLNELAKQTGIPKHNLHASLEVWNRMLDVGTDYQFGRFTSDKDLQNIKPISTAPYYALRVYPMTRKSMGGPAINIHGQIIDAMQVPIPGLYAAGELTGVAGINGSHGGSGTFLGPSVLTGRIAGSAAAKYSNTSVNLKVRELDESAEVVPDYGLPGYWHYDAVHKLVSERAQTCDKCHSEQMPMTMANKPAQMLAQLRTCNNCH
ncbi:MAG: FAD-dependent oxidoreductase [Gammaproteobacteria bacterium]|nr:FAD-dependent oxidoreductase [Gammaproteobacteria bacterium]MCP4089486.1 FAD-dependent oxidoreductase [Gammaproteobacteria bacterium]MCP4276192.1 FAD-dependent oxidoreductase [Gammaproteobacteria bacterium]MCP4832889.1 FAD-dependent oxidoreductase [Gammaproteobacteria bacterium]MCP4930014.1 FAD-dependent oxidoreductase [Gammaproteobacteria bacterium]